MAFENVQLAISSLLVRMGNQPEDKYGIEILLREKLDELKAYGMPLPQDLVDLEAALDKGLIADAHPSTGRTDKPEH